MRQPLARLVCVVPTRGAASKGTAVVLEELSPLLAAELNIKIVQFISSADDLVTLKARPNFRSLGKKFGKDTPLAAEAVQALSSEALAEFEAGKPLYVSVGNESRELSPEDLTVVRTASGDMVVLVLIERQRAEVGGLPEQDWSLRVTQVYRREGSEWRLVHRHADPLVRGISLEQAAAIARG